MNLTSRALSYPSSATFSESIGGSASGYLNGGLTYQFTANFQADARIGMGLVGRDAGGESRYFMGIGLARRW